MRARAGGRAARSKQRATSPSRGRAARKGAPERLWGTASRCPPHPVWLHKMLNKPPPACPAVGPGTASPRKETAWDPSRPRHSVRRKPRAPKTRTREGQGHTEARARPRGLPTASPFASRLLAATSPARGPQSRDACRLCGAHGSVWGPSQLVPASDAPSLPRTGKSSSRCAFPLAQCFARVQGRGDLADCGHSRPTWADGPWRRARPTAWSPHTDDERRLHTCLDANSGRSACVQLERRGYSFLPH